MRHSSNVSHVCPTCASELTQPVAWEAAGRDACWVSLRCPDCEWTFSNVFDEAAMERLDDALDRGTDALVGDLRVMARANMEHDVERLIAAIRAGHLLPEDF